jgi:hypothetical protein
MVTSYNQTFKFKIGPYLTEKMIILLRCPFFLIHPVVENPGDKEVSPGEPLPGGDLGPGESLKDKDGWCLFFIWRAKFPRRSVRPHT